MQKTLSKPPFCLVVSKDVYGLITPLKMTPSIYISIIMEEHDCIVFLQKLTGHSVNVFYLGDADCHGEESTVVTVFILVGGSSVVLPERAEGHVGVAVDNTARQGVGAVPVGAPANAIAAADRVILLRGRGKAGLAEIHLEVVVLDLEAGEEDECDDRRHDAPAARRLVLHVVKGGAGGELRGWAGLGWSSRFWREGSSSF